jgi:hypothetical protein
MSVIYDVQLDLYYLLISLDVSELWPCNLWATCLLQSFWSMTASEKSCVRLSSFWITKATWSAKSLIIKNDYSYFQLLKLHTSAGADLDTLLERWQQTPSSLTGFARPQAIGTSLRSRCLPIQ